MAEVARDVCVCKCERERETETKRERERAREREREEREERRDLDIPKRVDIMASLGWPLQPQVILPRALIIDPCTVGPHSGLSAQPLGRV